MSAEVEGLKAVQEWSGRIHGFASARHQWCMAAARAILADRPLPASGKGTAFGWRSTAEGRVETIRRILERES